MTEQTLSPVCESPGRGSALGSIFDGPEPDPSLVTVASGPYAEQLPVGNLTVGEVRERLRDRLDLDPHAVAVLDGHDVGNDVTVRPGQVLMFMHRAGEKGRGRRAVAA